jgi:hypothetical protein
MTEPLIIQSLKDKRGEIHGRIAAYQAQIAQAKHDLAHIDASIRLFTDPEHQRARYMVSHDFFKKGEIADICLRHLAIDGEMTMRELAERVMIERKLDATGTTLPLSASGCRGLRWSCSSLPPIRQSCRKWFLPTRQRALAALQGPLKLWHLAANPPG